MSKMLQKLVQRLALLGFVDDTYRNHREVNKDAGLVYFVKRDDYNPVEVYVSFNAENQILSIYQYNPYLKDLSYPIGFIKIESEVDTEAATHLLEAKLLHLSGSKEGLKPIKRNSLISELLKNDYEEVESYAHLRKFVKETDEHQISVIIESVVTLSLYIFKHSLEDGDKDEIIYAFTDVKDLDTLNYLKTKAITI